MPIFGSSDFLDYPVENPSNDTKGNGGAITIILSSGVNETVFDSLDTALRCFYFYEF